MRQVRSSGSVKAISLHRDELIRDLQDVSGEALSCFPEIYEIRLIGSLARGTHTGTSDVDLRIFVTQLSDSPLEQLRPYFFFFSNRIDIGVDIFLTGLNMLEEQKMILEDSLILASRRSLR